MMKKGMKVWKRKKNKDKDGSLMLSKGEVQSHNRVINSAAPMHFHFQNANCSFVMDENELNPSISESSLTGFDLTLMSTASSYSGNIPRYTDNIKSTASRRSVDAPGLVHGGVHYYNGHCGSSYNESENSSLRRERKARLLSPSRLLVCHAPAPEWPPSESFSVSSRNDSSQGSRSDKSPRYKDKNNRVVRNQYQQYTMKHSNIKSGRKYSDENESFDSEPPPDFHPREEIVHAIKCHEEMGKALSKLALSTQINGPNLAANSSFTATTLTGSSTFESFSTNSFRVHQSLRQLGARHSSTRNENRGNQQHSNHQSNKNASSYEQIGGMFIKDSEFIVGVVNKETQMETADSQSFSSGTDWTASECSNKSNTSSKSDGTSASFFQHVAFLEGLEDHMKKFIPSEISPIDQQTEEHVVSIESSIDFFPSPDDLRSPPPMTAPPKSPDYTSSGEQIMNRPPLLRIPQQGDVKDVHSLSPPCTPACIFAFPCHTEQYRSSIDSESVMHGISQIKEQTATMLEGMESRLKSDLTDLIYKEVVQIKSIMSEKSQQIASPAACESNSSFARSPFKPSNSFTRNAMTPQPERRTAPPSIDRNVLSEVIQKSLHSIETSILDKLTLHMNRDALEQRAYIEEMIDEKVTKVIMGQNLELQMAIGEMKRAKKQVAKQEAARPILQRSQSDANAVITPARHLTPIKFASRSTPNSADTRMSLGELKQESSLRILEDSFAETAKVLDDFVADCDDLVSDFDKIAFRMEDGGAENELPDLLSP